jgi:phage tail tape-measure protein
MDEKERNDTTIDSNPANRDPITNEPGSHPVGTGIGATGGAAAGAAAGALVGGPIGAVVGGVDGAVAGGAAGHAAGEGVNPTVEAEFWRQNYNKRPYYVTGKAYSEYEPAYRYGWESAARPEYRDRKFPEVEGELEKGWDKTKGAANHTWRDVKDATHDAWNRIRD